MLGLDTGRDSAERNLEEILEEAEEVEFTPFSEPPLVTRVANMRMQALEGKGEEPDAAFIDTEEGDYQIARQLEKYERETGSEGRIRIPVEIREDHDIRPDQQIAATIEGFGGENNDEYFEISTVTRVRQDGRFTIPKKRREHIDWDNGMWVNVRLFEILEDGLAEEYEEEVENWEASREEDDIPYGMATEAPPYL